MLSFTPVSANICTDYLKIESEKAAEEDVISWDDLVELFRETNKYNIPRTTPEEFTTLTGRPQRRTLILDQNNILGHAFHLPYEAKEGFKFYHFMASFKTNGSFQDYEVVFGLGTHDKSISIFKIRKMHKDRKNEYFNKVAEHSKKLMGHKEPEYYTIKGFYKGIKALRVSPRIEYKIKTRHQLELYDVVEPLHVGRTKSKFHFVVKNGYLNRESGFIFAKTESGESIKIVLEIIQEESGLVFNLKSAYRE